MPAICAESAEAFSNCSRASKSGYAYAYDDNVGLHTCATGANYTVTFCPNGSGGSGPAPIVNGDTYTVTPQNATGLRLDDEGDSTQDDNTIWVYTANGTGAQNWVFNNTGVSPAGYYNIALAGGGNCVTASGTGSTSLVNLQPCIGSSGQTWEAVPSGNFHVFHPANNTGNCMDVRGDGTGSGTLVQVYACNGGNNEQWALTVNQVFLMCLWVRNASVPDPSFPSNMASNWPEWETFMRICISSFGHFPRTLIRPLLAGTMAASLWTATVAAQQSVPQQGEDPVAMKNDIQQLKAQQQLIMDRLDELKKLLNAKRENNQPVIKAPDTMSVDGEPFRGEATAQVAIIEYGDIECPFCGHFKQSVYPRIFDEYIKTGKARFYYRDMRTRQCSDPAGIATGGDGGGGTVSG